MNTAVEMPIAVGLAGKLGVAVAIEDEGDRNGSVRIETAGGVTVPIVGLDPLLQHQLASVLRAHDRAILAAVLIPLHLCLVGAIGLL